MKRKFRRKVIACVVSAALVIGGIPAYSSNTADAAGSEGQGISIEASIDTSSGTTLGLTAKSSVKTGASYTYSWYIGTDRDKVEKCDTSCYMSNGTIYNQLATSDFTADGNAYIMVTTFEDPSLKSRLLEVKNFSLEVDSIAGVTKQDATDSTAKNGVISVNSKNNDLQYVTGGDISGKTPVDFTDWKLENLAAGQVYSVTYKKDIVEKTALKNGVYAVYKIGPDTVSPSPGATTTPTSTPVVTSTTTPTPASTKTPGSYVPPSWTAAPTEAPTATPTEAPTVPPVETVAPTEAPTVPPAETLAPTQAPTVPPVETAEPTEKPAETTKPVTPVQTQQPPATAAPENIDMSKSGTEVTVGGNSYKSTGSGSVSYTGSDLASAKTVTVPDTVTVNGKKYPVTEVGSKAFAGSKIQKVKIGSNVKKIGTNSFKGCKNLKTVTFPSKLNQVGDGAFNGCTKLSSATLPTSVKKIGDRAFKNCKSLKKFTIGKKPVKTKKGNIMFGGTANKITIGASALENCMKLRQVIINSQVTKIGNATFKNCKKLASIMVRSLMLQKVGGKALVGVNNCKISVPTIRLKKYRTLFKNKGQGKKVVIAKV